MATSSNTGSPDPVGALRTLPFPRPSGALSPPHLVRGGFEAPLRPRPGGSWNAKMLARRIGDRFGIIPCSRRTALRIAGRLGFSTCKPWSIPYNSATPEEQAAFIEKMKETIAR